MQKLTHILQPVGTLQGINRHPRPFNLCVIKAAISKMELLPDPVHDRVVREVRPPPHKPITRERLFIGNSNVPDWERLRDHL